MKIISRDQEIRLIREILDSDKPELTAIWGRRRVGKTYLIHNAVNEHKRLGDVYIQLTGSRGQNGVAQDQHSLVANFRVSIVSSTGIDPETSHPHEIFIYLARLVSTLATTGNRLILFLDEFPWLCDVKSTNFDFYQSFDHLWNNVFEKNGAKVFLCGSAASWMTKNIIYPKDGLAKRVTRKIKLSAFQLSGTKKFMEEKGFSLSSGSLLELQMLVGGIPFYLDQFNSQKSLRENFYQLLVSTDGVLGGEGEYKHLFRYLFSEPEYYMKIVSVISKKRSGISLGQLSMEMSEDSNYSPTNKLLDALVVLTESDILAKRIQFGNKSKGIYYFLIDEYIRLFNKWFVSDFQRIQAYSGFSSLLNSQAYKVWQGFNFELLCYRHHLEITSALGLSGISVSPNMFYHLDSESGKVDCQIDLLLDRSDRIITICEAKYYEGEYALTEQEYYKLINRREKLKEYLKIKRMANRDFNFCLIYSNRVKKNKYTEMLNPLLLNAEEFI